MRILSIGNSFSEDAQYYLHRVAKAQGCDITTANLYIGGCSLERHYGNMLSGTKVYSWQFNGVNTGLSTTLEDGLLAGHWDVVTLQQVSNYSPQYDTYQPYLSAIAEYVKKYSPKAKIIIHQTWAYEDGCRRLVEHMKYETWENMLRDIVTAYNSAAQDIAADGLIPSGDLLYRLNKNGIENVHRDGAHAGLGAGRYALSLLWLRMLCGVKVSGNDFSDFDVPVSDEEREIIWKTVDSFEPVCYLKN